MLLSKRAVFDSKKSKSMKEQEAKGVFSSLGTETPLRKFPLVGPLLIE